MKADIRKNLELAMNRRINELKSNALLEALVEKNKFDIPASMLKAEVENRWRMMAQQFQTTTEQLEKLFASSGQTKEEMLKNWEPDSEKMLKARVIVDALLRERNISVTPEEIEEEYSRIAAESNVTVEEVKKHYSDPRAKEYLIDDAKEQKLYKQLYSEVKVSKGDKVSFADLFNHIRADHCIGTISSNWCQLIYGLRSTVGMKSDGFIVEVGDQKCISYSHCILKKAQSIRWV